MTPTPQVAPDWKTTIAGLKPSDTPKPETCPDESIRQALKVIEASVANDCQFDHGTGFTASAETLQAALKTIVDAITGAGAEAFQRVAEALEADATAADAAGRTEDAHDGFRAASEVRQLANRNR